MFSLTWGGQRNHPLGCWLVNVLRSTNNSAPSRYKQMFKIFSISKLVLQFKLQLYSN